MEERKSFRGRLVFVSIFTALAALGLYLTLSLFVSARFGTPEIPASSVDSAGSVSSVSPAGQVAGGFALGLALGIVLVMAIMFSVGSSVLAIIGLIAAIRGIKLASGGVRVAFIVFTVVLGLLILGNNSIWPMLWIS